MSYGCHCKTCAVASRWREAEGDPEPHIRSVLICDGCETMVSHEFVEPAGWFTVNEQVAKEEHTIKHRSHHFCSEHCLYLWANRMGT